MIYNDKIIKAINIAYTIHEDEKDKINVPYIFHPFRVAEKIIEEESQFGGIKDCKALEDCIIIAFLHDTIESLIKKYKDSTSFVHLGNGLYKKFDSKESLISYFKTLLENNFGDIISNAVYTLTRKDNETYNEYIDRICKNSYAVKVKIHDIKDNMNANRIKLLNSKEKDGLSKRYFKALETLIKYERL